MEFRIGQTALGDNNVHSVRIVGEFPANLFEDKNFSGRSDEINHDEPNLDSRSLGGQYSSIRIKTITSCADTSLQGVYLYSEREYKGNCLYVVSDISDLGQTVIHNDGVRSLKVVGSYQLWLYEDKNFQGRNDRIGSDQHDLTKRSLGDQYSSVKVQRKNQAPPAPEPNYPFESSTLDSSFDIYLCWNAVNDPDGDAVQYQVSLSGGAVEQNSGWLDGTCWLLPEKNVGAYEWKVQVRDQNPQSLSSEWSQPFHFSITEPPTPVSTPTPTMTETPTPVATNTPTPTATQTPTAIQTPTLVATSTPTPVATLTPTPVDTGTPTPTATQTSTQTPTLVATNTPTPTSTNTPSAPANGEQPTPTPPAAQLNLSLPANSSVAKAMEIRVPLVAEDDMTGLNILSLQVEINYDVSVLQVIAVSNAQTLLNGWTVFQSLDSAGRIVIAAYGSSPLTGHGTLLNLNFNAVGDEGTSSVLEITKVILNEGAPTAIAHNGLVSVQKLGVAGNVTYRTTSEGVGGVLLTLQGPAVHSALTDSEGRYTLLPNLAGDYLLTPDKSADLNDAISALDAAWIAQCVIGKRAAGDCPLDVSDVSGDGTVGVYDAALLARYLVGMSALTSPMGEWRFTQPFRSYQPLTSEQKSQDFVASLVGDVTASWTVNTNSQTQSTTNLPTLILAPGRLTSDVDVILPLSISSILGAEITAYELTVEFDAQLLTLNTVTLDERLASDWNLVYHVTEPGVLKIVAYGVDALAVEGQLLDLHFTALDVLEGSVVQITSARLNEEVPMTNVTSAVIEPDQHRQVLLMPFIKP